MVTDIIEIIDSTDISMKKQFIQRLVDKIKLDGGTMTIDYLINEPQSSCSVMVAGVVMRYYSTPALAIKLPLFLIANNSMPSGLIPDGIALIQTKGV